MDHTHNANTSTPPLEQKPENQWGAIIGVVVIVLLLMLAGLYYWGSRITENEITESAQTSFEEAAAQAELAEMATQNGSDEPTAIEEDLTSEDFEDLDREMAEFEAELQADGTTR